METSLTVAEQAALLEWRKIRPVSSAKKFNKISVDNKKIYTDEDGVEHINPNFGSIFAYLYDENGAEIKEKIDIARAQFFPVRVRVQVRSKVMDGDKPMYYIPETEEFHNIHIFNKDKEEVWSGIYKEGKDKYQLSYSSVVYVWYEGNGYKWTIGGSGVNWFDVKKSLAKADFPMTFKVEKIEKAKTGSVEYNELTFAVGDKFPIQLALDVTKQFQQELDKSMKKIVEEDHEEEDQNEDKTISIEEIPF